MNSVDSIWQEIVEVQSGSYLIIRTEILEHEKTFLKVRLYLKDELYIQIYRNDEYNTTNFVLVLHDERIYARDEVRKKWHRHQESNPQIHDTTSEGKRAVNCKEFFEEVKTIIYKMKLV